MADLAKIVEDLSALTVLEAAELSKLLEEKWGVSAAAPVAAATKFATCSGVIPHTMLMVLPLTLPPTAAAQSRASVRVRSWARAGPPSCTTTRTTP